MSKLSKKLENKGNKNSKLSERINRQPEENVLNPYMQSQNGSYLELDINQIIPDPNQPRKHFDPEALEELSQSIKKNGVLQPVIIRKDQDKIILVAGERRYRAAKMAELHQIPAILTTGNPAEIALIENIQREDLNPMEEAEAFNRMIEEHKYTHEQLSLVIGKTRSSITSTLSLNRLPEEIKKECERVHIYPKRLLIDVARQKTPKKMISLFTKIKTAGLKSDDVKKLTPKKEKKHRTPGAIILDKATDLLNYACKIDFSTIEETEKINLKNKFQEIKDFIGKTENQY